jgi:AraC-like DNA-binding protein
MCHFVIIQKMTDPSEHFPGLSLPFGCEKEQVTSPRYFWNNADRGDGQFVIIQRTSLGKGLFVWEGRPFPVPSEHAFIATVPEASSYHFPAGQKTAWEFSWLNFYGPLAVLLCQDLRRQFGPVLPLPRRSPACFAYEALVAQGHRRAPADPHDTSIACYAFLVEWARQLGKPRPHHPDPAETAMRLCRTRFREPLGVKELAAESGLSREHFTRIFTDRTGLPPALYLRNLRTDAAIQMMADGSVPLKEAALRCGFASPRALSRALEARKSVPHRAPDVLPRKARAARR